MDIPPSLPLLSDYARHYAAATPEHEAMVFGDDRYSYARLAHEVDRCAKALIASGIGKGDRVAMLCPPHPQFLVLFLAASSIGAIWLGLNPRYRYEELRFVLDDAGPVLLLSRFRVGEREYRDDIAKLRSGSVSLRDVVRLDGSTPEGVPVHDEFRDDESPYEESPHDELPYDECPYDEFLDRAGLVTDAVLAEKRRAVRTKDAALIVYTSGSTGRPKGAVISHYSLIKCSRVQLRFWGANPLRILNFLPINHIGCVGDICCYSLVGGGTTIFLEKFEPESTLRLLESEAATVWGGVPTTFQLCVDHPDFEAFDLSAISTIFWSGAAASPDLIRRLRNITPRLSTSYGMTETVGSVTYSPVCDDIELLAETIGRPPPEYQIRVIGDDGAEAGPGQSGELQVRGDFLMTEYWNQPEATAETIDEDGWLHTGDVAEYRPDGNLRLVGRLRDMFKSGGYNVYPREIEAVVESHPDVAVCAVIGVPDRVYQEVGMAFVELRPGGIAGVSELDRHCRDRLANYKVPKTFVIESRLPRLPIGKIHKQALRKAADALLAGERSTDDPAS